MCCLTVSPVLYISDMFSLNTAKNKQCGAFQLVRNTLIPNNPRSVRFSASSSCLLLPLLNINFSFVVPQIPSFTHAMDYRYLIHRTEFTHCLFLSVQCNSWHWTDIKSLECLSVCVCLQNVSSTIATTIFVRSS